MEDVHAIIAGLRKRVADIAAGQARAGEALRAAERERERLKADKSALEEENAELRRRVRALELSRGVESVSGGSKGAVDRVNRLLREVDKCIALMNR